MANHRWTQFHPAATGVSKTQITISAWLLLKEAMHKEKSSQKSQSLTAKWLFVRCIEKHTCHWMALLC